ncbi:MAG: DUF1573 domain-containing protein [Candidatus Bathyarchaeia archaeon]
MKGSAFKVLWGMIVVIPIVAFYRFSTSPYKYKLPQNAPLRFNKTTHDFGEVKWGTSVDANFYFVNATPYELMIERITNSCGCTVVSLSASHFRPSEQGVLTLRFLPTGFIGQVTQMVQVWIKDHKSPITLYLKANVNPLLQPIPEKINFGQISSCQPVATTLVLRNTSGKQVCVTRLETFKEYIKASVLKDGDEPTIRVELVNPPVGKLYDRLYIYTSLPERSQIDVPIQANIACKWDLSDTEFFFGFVNLGDRISRKVRVRGLPSAAVKRVWTTTSVATVNVVPFSDGIELAVNLDLRKVKVEASEEIKGDVFIETKDQEQPLIRLPIVGVIQNPDHIGGCCQGQR